MVWGQLDVLAALYGWHEMMMSEFSREFWAWVIIAAIWLFNFPAIPKFFREVAFYRSRHWNFREESNDRVFLQDQFADRFANLPIGVVKLLLLAVRVGFFCGPFIAAYNGYRLSH